MADPWTIAHFPAQYQVLLQATAAIHFSMASEPLTGTLLQALAASRPQGQFLEIGTGTGLSTAWLLAGMDSQSQLVSLENDPQALAIAQQILATDTRVSFVLTDAAQWLGQAVEAGRSFDLIFADTWAGKFTHLDQALALLKPGGLYVIDDLLPQANWTEGHGEKVAALIEGLEQRSELAIAKLQWASGLLIASRRAS